MAQIQILCGVPRPAGAALVTKRIEGDFLVVTTELTPSASRR